MQPALHHIFKEGPPFRCIYPMSAPENEIEQFLGGERLHPQDSSFQNFTYTIKGELPQGTSAYAATQGFSVDDPVMMDLSEGVKVVEIFSSAPEFSGGTNTPAVTSQFNFFSSTYNDTVVSVSYIHRKDGTGRTRITGAGGVDLADLPYTDQSVGLVFNANGGELLVKLGEELHPRGPFPLAPQEVQLVMAVQEAENVASAYSGESLLLRLHASREQWFQDYPEAATGICEPLPQNISSDGRSLGHPSISLSSTPILELELSGFYEEEYQDGASLEHPAMSLVGTPALELFSTKLEEVTLQDGSGLPHPDLQTNGTPVLELVTEVV